jgi:hypothetical protein
MKAAHPDVELWHGDVADDEAMGQGAVRSQMDVRISFRVRERKDVDLILGQGMLAAGWHAHTLNAPGKFLVAAAEHDVPKRARAYLATGQAVASTNAIYADSRPPLYPISRRALVQDLRSGDAYPERDPIPNGTAQRGTSLPPSPPTTKTPTTRQSSSCGPRWQSLHPKEPRCPTFLAETGMSRPWVYLRLASLEGDDAARSVQRPPPRGAHAPEPAAPAAMIRSSGGRFPVRRAG